jgi:hypothetical protein
LLMISRPTEAPVDPVAVISCRHSDDPPEQNLSLLTPVDWSASNALRSRRA